MEDDGDDESGGWIGSFLLAYRVSIGAVLFLIPGWQPLHS